MGQHESKGLTSEEVLVASRETIAEQRRRNQLLPLGPDNPSTPERGGGEA